VLQCDGYGGRIADVAADATAFPRLSWTRAADTPAHVANVAKVYAALRSFMPGAAYVNYCDLDLPDYPTAYWGDNLPRLMEVKQQYDPDNLFRHAQSVPLPPQAWDAPISRASSRAEDRRSCEYIWLPSAISERLVVDRGGLFRLRAERVRGADVLVIEATFLERDAPYNRARWPAAKDTAV
jgi:hypothetical protein